MHRLMVLERGRVSMNGGILPIALLFVSTGLALALVPWRDAWFGIAALALSALLVSVLPIPPSATDAIFIGLWTSIIATAATSYSTRYFSDRLIIALAINNGVWAGALAATSGMRAGLVLAIPIALIALPGQRIAARDFGIVLKVVASWVIAIASLAIFVSLTSTPGYKPDHMG